MASLWECCGLFARGWRHAITDQAQAGFARFATVSELVPQHPNALPGDPPLVPTILAGGSLRPPRTEGCCRGRRPFPQGASLPENCGPDFLTCALPLAATPWRDLTHQPTCLHKVRYASMRATSTSSAWSAAVSAGSMAFLASSAAAALMAGSGLGKRAHGLAAACLLAA
jgi:hypothetical protein